MGKVYSQELRDQDDEIERFGMASEATRQKATSAWVPDLSGYEFLPQFAYLDGIDFRDVKTVYAEWRKLGSPIVASQVSFEYLVRQSGMADRMRSRAKPDPRLEEEEDWDDDETKPKAAAAEGSKPSKGYKLNEEEIGKMAILAQFNAFKDRQRQCKFRCCPVGKI